jgi:hypothetical protein
VRVACISSLDGRLCIKKPSKRMHPAKELNEHKLTNKQKNFIVILSSLISNNQHQKPSIIQNSNPNVISSPPPPSGQVSTFRFPIIRLISLTSSMSRQALSLMHKLRLHPTNQSPLFRLSLALGKLGQG